MRLVKDRSFAANAYTGAIVLLGLVVITSAFNKWKPADVIRYFAYFSMAIFASTLKLTLPGVSGTMSVNILFILIGIAELSLPETLLMGCTATVIRWVCRVPWRLEPIKVLFHVSNMAVAIAVSTAVYHSYWLRAEHIEKPVMLLISAGVFFVMNTFPVAAVITLAEGRHLKQIWRECSFWSLPYYLISAGIAVLFGTANQYLGWQVSLCFLPLVYLIYRSYRVYLGRLEDEKKHAEQISSLHLRTIEALALAIDAKDHTTHDHLRRVQIYAIEIGKELGMSGTSLDALRAAALLHDIGKLAVPEHIISKPGKLTPEEFEKMKIHPVVGAEILERVQFPYDVVPIVRAHHEKWNGAGYPYGLKGEEIPIGARILSAVDCLDALASDRQYRRALPLNEAMAQVMAESGTSFDPRVVEVLQRRYKELEQMALIHPSLPAPVLSTELKIEKGLAPAAGFETPKPPATLSVHDERIDFLSSIAAARQEVQALFELSQDLGNSLSLSETLSVFAARLKKIVPHDAIAMYVRRDDKLLPEFVSGDDFRVFSSLEIVIGQGLSGWVAENRRSILNGNPSVESGYTNDPGKFSTLRSALAVPLEGVKGVVGVLTLYHSDKDAFSRDHLRILMAITSKVSLSIENALKYRQAESSATTDFLTGLPNARSLFLHLHSELSRCRRLNIPLALLVCDLDGFKQVNDSFGHLEGNRVLQLVAKGLKESCRDYDYVARMGGDEFVLVFPGLHLKGVHAKTILLSNVATLAGRQVCGEDLLALSVGEAFFPQDSLDAEGLLAEADRRMYMAKQEHKAGIIARRPVLHEDRPATSIQ